MSKRLLKCEKLGKRFPGAPYPVLQGVSFDVFQGDRIAVLGPNGAGKSTLLAILVGLSEATEGEIHFDLSDDHPRVGFLPQNDWLDPYATGWQNLRFQAELLGIELDRGSARARELLTTLGLDEAADQLVLHYSGGMKRRLALALALINEPAILVLDEPTNALDPSAREELIATLERLPSKEMALIMVTHALSEAERVCDRVVMIDSGTLLLQTSVRALVEDVGGDVVTIEAAYGNEMALEQQRSFVEISKRFRTPLFFMTGKIVKMSVPGTISPALRSKLMEELEPLMARFKLKWSWSAASLSDAYFKYFQKTPVSVRSIGAGAMT